MVETVTGPGGSGPLPDHAARVREFLARHPHVTITATMTGWRATWIEACPGRRDGEPAQVSREILGHLMDHLEARFHGTGATTEGSEMSRPQRPPPA